MNNNNYLKEFVYIFFVLIINIVAYFFVSGFFGIRILIGEAATFKFLVGLGVYAMAFFAALFLVNRFPSKFLKIFLSIIFSPLIVFFLLLFLLIPISVIQFGVIFFIGVCFLIPFLLLKFLMFVFTFEIPIPLMVYLTLTIGVIMPTLFHYQIKKLVSVILGFTKESSLVSLKSNPINGVFNYLLSEKNIKFLMFLIYLIIIICNNVFNLRQIPFLHSFDLDKAVLQSFVTFVAFDRVIANLKQLEFKPSDLFKKMLDFTKAYIKDILLK